MTPRIPAKVSSSAAGRTGTSKPVSVWRDRRAVHRTVAGDLLSVANLVGRPVIDPTGSRVARLNDIVVRWESDIARPPIVSLVVRIGNGVATIAATEVTLTQSVVRLRPPHIGVALPAHHGGDVALVRDVLDHQLVDVTGVNVVRAADVYLAKAGSGWELAGIDIGLRALLRRLLPPRSTCPTPDRALDWTELQAFVARFPGETPPEANGPADAAGLSGSSLQAAHPASALHTLRPRDVAALLRGLDRAGQAQLSALADTSTVAEALGDLEPAQMDALLAELDEVDRAKLEGQLRGGSR